MKPTLVFIHGLRGNALGLKEVAKKFPKKSFDIHMLEVPPAGNNTLKEYTARLYARFVAEYIKENKLEKPILIGHSMGSIVAAAVAERYPDLISDKIVFLSPISVHPNKFFSALTPFSAIMPNKFVGFITTKYLYVPKSDKELNKELFKKTLMLLTFLAKTIPQGLMFTNLQNFLHNTPLATLPSTKKPSLFLGRKIILFPTKKLRKLLKNLMLRKSISKTLAIY